MKTRNPVAGNAWKYNKKTVQMSKKEKLESKRIKVKPKDIEE